MLHAQREGRINRTGQADDVEMLDHEPDHPEIKKARARLTEKYGLRDLMTSPMESLDETGIGAYLKARGVYADAAHD
jgi:hypothetical protein